MEQNSFVLYYIHDCVYWYISEALGNWFVDALVRICHVNFLGFSHWFMSIRISQLRYQLISVDQDRYATAVVAKYIDNTTVNNSKIFIRPI